MRCRVDTGERIRVEFTENQSVNTTLVGNFLKPLEIEFEPNIVEFSIVFKPLGVNFFTRENLGEAMSKNISQTNLFADLKQVAREFMISQITINDFEDRLISIFASKPQLEFLEKVIEIFCDSENALTEKQIANHLGISAKQLFRLFKKHPWR